MATFPEVAVFVLWEGSITLRTSFFSDLDCPLQAVPISIFAS
jgi:hypothetical protein